MCERWGGLPEQGAVMDQDYATIYRGSFLENVYHVVSRVREMKGAQIHGLTKAERRLIRWLRDEDLMR